MTNINVPKEILKHSVGGLLGYLVTGYVAAVFYMIGFYTSAPIITEPAVIESTKPLRAEYTLVPIVIPVFEFEYDFELERKIAECLDKAADNILDSISEAFDNLDRNEAEFKNFSRKMTKEYEEYVFASDRIVNKAIVSPVVVNNAIVSPVIVNNSIANTVVVYNPRIDDIIVHAYYGSKKDVDALKFFTTLIASIPVFYFY